VYPKAVQPMQNAAKAASVEIRAIAKIRVNTPLNLCSKSRQESIHEGREAVIDEEKISAC
jgi:hypothetical protein